MGEYDHLFYKFPKEETHTDMLPPVQAYFRGEFSVPGASVYLPYRAYIKAGKLEEEPHFHRDEEYIAIVGHDLRDAFDSFDAELTFYLGETLDDMEKIVIDKPTMIRIPPFYWHGPLEITRLGMPVFIQPVLFNSRYYAIYQRKDSEGRPYFESIVEGIERCKLNPGKSCHFCGKCKEVK